MVQAKAESINKGVFANSKRGPTLNDMFSDENILADIWVCLKPSLVCSIEHSYILLGNSESCLCRSLLSINKHFKTICLHLRTQIVAFINNIDLTLSIPDIMH